MIKSFCRYTAVEQPGHLDQVTQVLAIRQKKTPALQLDHLTGNEVRTLLAEPGTASARAVRDTVLLALAYDSAARVQELCDLDVADIRRGRPMTVVIRGKGSKIRYVPAMEPTAQLIADVDLGGRHIGMAEQIADVDQVDAGLDQVHGPGPPERMRRDRQAGSPAGVARPDGPHVAGQQLSHPDRVNSGVVRPGEQRVRVGADAGMPIAVVETPRPNAGRLKTPTNHSPQTPCRTGPWTRP